MRAARPGSAISRGSSAKPVRLSSIRSATIRCALLTRRGIPGAQVIKKSGSRRAHSQNRSDQPNAMRYPLGAIRNGCAKYSGFLGGCKGAALLDLTPSKDQKTRRALLPRGLGVISRAAELRPRPPPVVSALRRPFEIWRAQKPLQRPCRVIGDIGNKAALPVAAFWPRVGMNELDTGERAIGKPFH